MRNKVLLVEDDHLIVENLAEFLTGEGFEIRSADGQQKAMELLEKHKFDLILLDITLAQGNGYSVCTAVKALYQIPIIFLTALDDEFSVVTGLDMGADDYISKPFRPRELVSRMRMVIRRFYGEKEKIQLQTGKLEIDTARGIVKKNGQEVFLTSLEYRLLLLFFQKKGKVLSRDYILEELWDIAGEYVNDNTLTVYIKRLREKIEDSPQNPQIIKTVRGLGYKMEE
ncbi:MAG: response regulator transcription factor [Bariatricus sp.]